VVTDVLHRLVGQELGIQSSSSRRSSGQREERRIPRQGERGAVSWWRGRAAELEHAAAEWGPDGANVLSARGQGPGSCARTMMAWLR